MFTTKSGEKIFVIDGHTHLWDGSPANQRNIHGKQFIDCFYDYHHLGPDSYIWPKEKFERYTEEDYVKDVFEEGYADVAKAWLDAIEQVTDRSGEAPVAAGR